MRPFLPLLTQQIATLPVPHPPLFVHCPCPPPSLQASGKKMPAVPMTTMILHCPLPLDAHSLQASAKRMPAVPMTSSCRSTSPGAHTQWRSAKRGRSDCHEAWRTYWTGVVVANHRGGCVMQHSLLMIRLTAMPLDHLFTGFTTACSSSKRMMSRSTGGCRHGVLSDVQNASGLGFSEKLCDWQSRQGGLQRQNRLHLLPTISPSPLCLSPLPSSPPPPHRLAPPGT